MKYFVEQKGCTVTEKTADNLDYASHLHDHIEMVYVFGGNCRITVDDKTYDLMPNDFFIVFPNQIHSYTNSDNLECYIMIFPPNLLPEFKELFSLYVPENPVVSNNSEVKQLFDILRNKKGRSAEFIHGILLTLCSCAFEDMNMLKQNRYNIDAMKSVLIYIEEHFTEPVDIEEAAKNLHISRSHISHIFRDKLDTTFTKYITEKRLDYACELLKKGDMTVTDAAFNSGFGSIRTFNRVFTVNKGISPGKYKSEFGNAR